MLIFTDTCISCAYETLTEQVVNTNYMFIRHILPDYQVCTAHYATYTNQKHNHTKTTYGYWLVSAIGDIIMLNNGIKFHIKAR